MSGIRDSIKNAFGRLKGVITSPFKKKEGAKRKSHLAMNQVLSVKETKKIPNRKQLRHLPKLLNKTEKRLVVLAGIIVIIAGSALAIRLVNTQRSEVPAVGGEYTEGLIGSPQLINPLYSLTSDVDTDLSRLVYNGLMRYDTERGLVPDLAESYTISEDQTVYEFVLREDAKWHDGQDFRAADVIFTINAIQTPDYRSPMQISFSGATVEQVDERIVRFTLNEPFAPFLSLLTVGILPSHIWGEITPINASLTEFNKKPVGTGPYKFEKLVKDSKGSIRSYTFTRNANFHRGAPYIQTLNFKFYPDTTSAIEALRNNNVEGLSFLPTEEIATFERDSQLQLIFPALQQYTAAFINLNREEKLGDVEVRQALTHATNKQLIVEQVLNNHGRAIDSFILEGMLGEHPDVQTYEYNIDRARELLQEAGWELEDNSIVRAKGETPLIIELVTLNSTELTSVAEELKRQWAEVGVDLQIRAVDNATFQSDILKNRSYDILLSGELYGIDPDPYAFWHSSQAQSTGLNLSGFSNRNADELIETGRTTTNREERAEAYRELQNIVAENVPAIFLYQPTYTYAVAKKIHGTDIPQIVIPADRFSDIETWYIKTKRTLKKTEDAAEPQPETAPEEPEPTVEEPTEEEPEEETEEDPTDTVDTEEEA